MTPANLTLTQAGNVSTSLGNVSVTFNGVPAPLTYVSANQVNAVVPYEVAGNTSVSVVVSFNGTASTATTATVAPTAPAIFTLTQNGSGQGAILNQDLTVNGATNAAAKGTVIALYGTGGGVLNPATATGSVTPSTGSTFPAITGVTVTIGGVPAQVFYSGAAPGTVSGVIQVNALIPDNVPSGNQAVVLTVNGVSSPAVTTVTVQ